MAQAYMGFREIGALRGLLGPHRGGYSLREPMTFGAKVTGTLRAWGSREHMVIPVTQLDCMQSTEHFTYSGL